MRLPPLAKRLLARKRPAGDLAFAFAFLAFSVFLFSQLGTETSWVKRTKLFAQPAFWPTVGIFGMMGFGALHFLGALVSSRTAGRWEEALVWARSIEFALWFMAYVLITPRLGYLPTTLVFAVCLTYRVGFRSPASLSAAAGTGLAIVVLFKAFLQVKIPGGVIYEFLPAGLRSFMILNF